MSSKSALKESFFIRQELGGEKKVNEGMFDNAQSLLHFCDQHGIDAFEEHFEKLARIASQEPDFRDYIKRQMVNFRHKTIVGGMLETSKFLARR